jgi:hypothetical protein
MRTGNERIQLGDIRRTGRTREREGEESSILISVTRKRLLTLLVGEDLVLAVVIYGMLRIAVTL